MYAKVNGTTIFFDVIGKEVITEGPCYYRKPICFVVHGGPGACHFSYLPAINELADTFQMIMIDSRNTGLSPHGDYHENSMKQDAADVEALRQYLGLDKIFLLGQSYGGMLAQQYAIDYGENLQGLILVTTTPDYRFESYADPVVQRRGSDEQKMLWEMKKAGKITNMSEYIGKMSSLYSYRCVTPELLKQSVDANICVAKVQNTEVNLWQRHQGGELSTFDHKPYLNKVSCPVLIIGGAEDFITAPICSEHIKECIPHAELHILEESCHMAFDDRPDACFPLIKDFVNRIAPRELI